MRLLIVMYHHIDSEKKYKSGIYPISIERFTKQLDIIRKKYTFINEDKLVKIIGGSDKLPDINFCFLTFDDSLRCQYDNAIPVLKERRIPATFYINSKPYLENSACSVHLIHWLLTFLDPKKFLEEIYTNYNKITGNILILSEAEEKEASKFKRYDNKDISKLKFILNNYLDVGISEIIIGGIFKKYSKIGMLDFCKKLYMSVGNLKNLLSDSLFSLGMHTNSHINISKLSQESLNNEYQLNYNFLCKIGANVQGIAYPYGTFGDKKDFDSILSVNKNIGILYGLTTLRNININLDSPFYLSRCDTNDIKGGKNPIISI